MKACPSGWHLPTHREWNELGKAVGGASIAGKYLKSTSGWFNGGNGTDDYGFSALPGGFYFDGRFTNRTNYARWWSATESSHNAPNADGHSIYFYYDYMHPCNLKKSDGYYVRCVQDER